MLTSFLVYFLANRHSFLILFHDVTFEEVTLMQPIIFPLLFYKFNMMEEVCFEKLYRTVFSNRLQYFT